MENIISHHFTSPYIFQIIIVEIILFILSLVAVAEEQEFLKFAMRVSHSIAYCKLVSRKYIIFQCLVTVWIPLEEEKY